MKPIYLDYNATTPVLPEVAEAMQPYLSEIFGNPSSSHWYGVQTKKAIETARRQVAELINCQPEEIIFTSGGSESNNYAIKGIANACKNKGNHIITSQIEHPAVHEVCSYLEKNGYQISYISVDETGLIKLDELERSITPQTILITIMHANNEVGTIQPISEISHLAKKNGIVFHCDAAQSVGKISVDVGEMGVDLLSIAGHKLYAPKGIGALYIRRGIKLEKMIHGADHERNLRAGTENVLEIVGLGKAAEIAKRDFQKNYNHMKNMRDFLFDELQKNLEDKVAYRVNGHPENRLPNTLSISFANIEANTLLSKIEDKVAASAGAACHSDEIDISKTLEAMHVPIEFAMGTIRISTGKLTSKGEINESVKVISNALFRLQPSQEVKSEIDIKTDIKLTRFTHGLGCACKLRPQALEKILSSLPVPNDKNILIGTNTSDDAAVYKIDENTAIVQTVDFFTPIVDDPYDYGAIAAANSLSDIYAMGAKPLFALNIVGFPSNRLPLEVLKQILKGAQDKAEEAGIPIIGGHTIDDTEPKFGLSVCGIVHPDKILTNSNAQSGDSIILTKPIGLGILTTALKRGLLDEAQSKQIINIMSTLNQSASNVLKNYPVNSCTDVTGFGLLGHLKEMSSASKVDAKIYADKVPVIDFTIEMAMAGAIPGGTENNMEYLSEWIQWVDNVSDITKAILCDAQTSGGLLISVNADFADDLVKDLYKNGVKDAQIIGSFTEKGKGIITVE